MVPWVKDEIRPETWIIFPKPIKNILISRHASGKPDDHLDIFFFFNDQKNEEAGERFALEHPEYAVLRLRQSAPQVDLHFLLVRQHGIAEFRIPAQFIDEVLIRFKCGQFSNHFFFLSSLPDPAGLSAASLQLFPAAVKC